MRTINSHRGAPLSLFHSLAKLYPDENTAGITGKALITEGGYGGGTEGKKRDEDPFASETFPVQFNMLRQLFLICCFLAENRTFLHQVLIPQGFHQLFTVQVETGTGNLAWTGLCRMFSKCLIVSEIMTTGAMSSVSSCLIIINHWISCCRESTNW